MATSFKEFYGQERNVNSVLFPKKIGSCLKSLGMEVKEYIYEHSVLPFYRLFLKDGLYSEICEQMQYGNKAYTKRLTTQQNHGANIKSDRIYYCPECMRKNRSYTTIKRFHQIKGVFLCPEHSCYLKSVPIKGYKKILNIEEWDTDSEYCFSEPVLMQVAKDVEYIIDNPPEMDNWTFRECLLDEAIHRNAFRYQHWNEDEHDGWKTYYEELPVQYASFKKRASFQRFAAYEIQSGIDPIEYLVFIQSLYGSFKNFIDVFG